LNWQSWLFWGIAATAAQAAFESAMPGFKLTRLSLPFLAGTMFTAQRSRARLLGFALHLLNGLLFALPYIAAFHFLGGQSWWRGLLLGLAQGSLVLLVAVPLIPEFHPRMATERTGPTAKRLLEPPGFLALNYGAQTPLAILASHAVYGVVIGSFCHA
jgi:hypothetical protein